MNVHRTPGLRRETSLQFASDIDNVAGVRGRHKSKRRSGCPVSIALDGLGDKWSLLIVRDLMVRGCHTFREFEASGEGISTNVLADRLRRLKSLGIVAADIEESDARRVNYRLTAKGIDLAPVLLELLIWSARHEQTGTPCLVIEEMARHRQALLAEVRRRWKDRDPRPLQMDGRWVWPS